MKAIKYGLLLLCFNIFPSEESSNSQQTLPPTIIRLMSFIDCLKATEYENMYELIKKHIYDRIDFMIVEELNQKIKFYESCIKKHLEETDKLDKEIAELYEQREKCIIRTESETDSFGKKREVEIVSSDYFTIDWKIKPKYYERNEKSSSIEFYNKHLAPFIALKKQFEEVLEKANDHNEE